VRQSRGAFRYTTDGAIPGTIPVGR